LPGSGTMFVIILLFFFFSSRRRHTRSKRDWSSDVCSSDLENVKFPLGSIFLNLDLIGQELNVFANSNGRSAAECQALVREMRSRSEERRVGKECRSRWWAS